MQCVHVFPGRGGSPQRHFFSFPKFYGWHVYAKGGMLRYAHVAAAAAKACAALNVFMRLF